MRLLLIALLVNCSSLFVFSRDIQLSVGYGEKDITPDIAVKLGDRERIP